MSHLKDGTPAKIGDLIIHKDAHDFGSEKIGILTEIQPSDSWNGNVHYLAKRQNGTDVWFPMLTGNNLWSVTLKECVRAVPQMREEMAEPVT